MAETKYTFSIAVDTGSGIVNSDSLTTEIESSAILESLTRIETLADVLDIYFANALSGGDVTALNGVVAAHTGVVPELQLAQTTGITRDPLVTDDITVGFKVRDRWYNSSSEEEFICVDNTAGAAVWKRITALGLASESALTDLQSAINSGIDLADHNVRHISGGADEIDGDQIDIDFTPSTYVPTTAPPEVSNLDHLSAHLAGIDAALGSVVSDDKTVKVSIDDTTPGFLEDKIVGSTNISLSTLNPAGNEQLQISATGLALNSTQIIAGAGLTGGGDLSANRTLDVVANADGSIVVNANDIQVGILATDAQHGNRGGGSLHANATTSVAGFLSATDKTKLDGIEAGAQVNDVDSVFGRTGAVVAQASDYDANQIDFTPNGDIAATDVQAAIVEVRDDTDTKLTGKANVTHASTHLPSGSDPLITAAASTLTPDLSNAEGTAESFARSDHIHNIPAEAPSSLTPELGNSEGTNSSFARSDHIHNLPTNTPVTLNPDTANAEGVAASFARSDHIHNVPTDTAVNIEAGGTNIEGVSTSFARADHIHRIIDPSTEVSATGNISTTSSSPITATSMTITPGAGTYIVIFSAYGLHNNNNAELAIGIAVSGTDVSESERRWGGTNFSDSVFATLSTQAKVIITAGQTIQGRFWKPVGGGSVELENRTLTIIKVDT